MTVYRAAGVDYRVTTLNYDGSTQPTLSASLSSSGTITATIEHNPVITGSISGSASAIYNVGPGLGSIIGPNGNFSDLSNFSKLSLSLGMLLGRLELFAVLVLFFPSFWKN